MSTRARIPEEDLTTKARIRHAALKRFATDGLERTTIRAIAADADVAANIVIYHYGSKDGLIQAVDSYVAKRFSEIVAAVHEADWPKDITRRTIEQLAMIVRNEPALIDYLARSLVNLSDSATALFDTLFELTRHEQQALRDAGMLHPEVDLDIAALQTVTRLLGALVLRPLIDRHLPEPLLSEAGVEHWLDAGAQLIERGLLLQIPTPRSQTHNPH